VITIRVLALNDLNSLVNLLQQLWIDKQIDETAVKEVIERGIKSPHQFYICANIEEKLVGFCSLSIKNNLWTCANLGNVDELVVDSNYRNKGIGKMLLHEIEKLARSKGCKRLELDSAFHRNAAHDFYNKLGFQKRAFLFTKEL
jgi:ribosomal protein S18 acetylase RimI-like enzyme